MPKIRRVTVADITEYELTKVPGAGRAAHERRCGLNVISRGPHA
jgi:hypothetical protein